MTNECGCRTVRCGYQHRDSGVWASSLHQTLPRPTISNACLTTPCTSYGSVPFGTLIATIRYIGRRYVLSARLIVSQLSRWPSAGCTSEILVFLFVSQLLVFFKFRSVQWMGVLETLWTVSRSCASLLYGEI